MAIGEASCGGSASADDNERIRAQVVTGTSGDGVRGIPQVYPEGVVT
jgi:hypothetical protein